MNRLAVAGGVGVLAILGLGIFVFGRSEQEPSSEPAAEVASEDGLEAAKRWIEQGEPERARALLDRLIQGRADDQELWIAMIEARLHLEDPQGAYEACVSALAVGPRTAPLEFQAGTLASTIDRRDLAIEHYSMAQSLEPSDPQIALFLGSVLHAEGRAEEAKASLVRASALDPGLALARGTLAEIAMQENKPSVALEHARAAAAQEPTRLAWKLIQARALTRLAQPTEALSLLSTVAEAESWTPPVLSSRAAALGLLNRAGDAADLYASAVERSPSDPELVLQAATWAERAGRVAEALRFAERASMLGSDIGQRMADRLQKASSGG